MSVGNGSDVSGFTLSKVVEDVSQHSFAQTEALKEKEKTLQLLEATLAEAEDRRRELHLELRSKTCQLLTLESDVEKLDHQTQTLLHRNATITQENARLQSQIKEEQEKASSARAQYHAYRAKMEEHRGAVVEALSETEANKELEETRARVKMLEQEKEELRKELENPDGNAEKEIRDLKEQITAQKKDIAEKRLRLRKETEAHGHMKRDIEIQNKRYEAVVKRLCCQRNKAQAAHRLMSSEVSLMEKQISELKERLQKPRGPSTRP